MAVSVFVFFLHPRQPGKGVRVAHYTIDHFARDTLGLAERQIIKLVFFKLLHHLHHCTVNFLVQLACLLYFALQRRHLAVQAALDFQRRQSLGETVHPLASRGFFGGCCNSFQVGRDGAAALLHIDVDIIAEGFKLIDLSQIAQVKTLQRKGCLRPGAIQTGYIHTDG